MDGWWIHPRTQLLRKNTFMLGLGMCTEERTTPALPVTSYNVAGS